MLVIERANQKLLVIDKNTSNQHFGDLCFTGDTVIVKKASNVDSGQIAVVLIDDQEATLKRVRKKGNTIALEAANRNYLSLIHI